MADKKLNEVTKVTDMAYVPVIMSDGSIGQIAKADLASVVAGVLGNPVGSKNSTIRDTNFNDIVDNGIYTIFSGVGLNAPVESSIRLLLTVEKNNIGVIKQTATRFDMTESYYRMKTLSDSWQPWQRIDNFGYNSLAELANGVAANDTTRLKSLQGKRMVKIGAVPKWGSGSFLASIANASGSDTTILSVSYRHMSTAQNVSYSRTNDGKIGIEIYKKTVNDILEVYLYSTLNEDSINPVVALSSHNLEHMGIVTDLSSYTLVASL